MTTPDQSNLNKTARDLFAGLLPAEYSPPITKIGSVRPSLADVNVVEGPRHYRGGNFFADLLLLPLGKERYLKERRGAAIGKTAIRTWAANVETDRLTIEEARYEPIRPVGGSRIPCAHLRAAYVLAGSMDDLGDVHEAGITFNFLQIGDDQTHAGVSPYLPSPHATGPSLGYEFLKKYGFTTNTRQLGPQIVDLAKVCIQLAQEPKS